MNAITLAFQTAGVKPPTQFQRIWTWLRDHQPQTAKAVQLALQLPQSSSMLAQMERRGMVTSKTGFDTRMQRIIKMYNAAGREYELLPLPVKPKVAKQHSDFVAGIAPAPMPIAPAAIQTVAPTDKFDIESMTIGEARALYFKLNAVFGGV